MLRSHILVTAALVVAALSNAAAAQQTLSFQSGVNGYTGSVDNSLSYGLPDTPNTDGDILWVDWITVSKGEGTHGLLRFDNIFGNGPGRIPANSTILSSTLQFQTGPSSIYAPGAGGPLHRMLQNWTNTDTWNTLGGDGIQANGIEAAVPYYAQLGTGASSNLTGLVTTSVLTDVQAWANGTPNYGWAILPWTNGTNGWGFYSDSYADVNMHEKLTVTFIPPVPEPMTASILILACAALARRRTPRQSA